VRAITLSLVIGHLSLALAIAAEPKPVPRLQVIPEPYHQASFTRDGTEIARYHFSPTLRRPFLYPLVGPSGRSLTRMGHPRDPEGHSHHNSVWISHNDVNGLSFWDDRKTGKIVHQKVEAYEDEGNDTAAIQSINHWIDEKTNAIVLQERRRTELHLLPDNELLLLLDLKFETRKDPVTLGKTPFGLVGVRMAKTIGTLDGGGTIRNSEGQINEVDAFRKPARWCDYSGPIAKDTTEGITLFDHPSNPNHPVPFHVRGDGWMGAALTHLAQITITTEKPLRLRYALYVHAGMPTPATIDHRWKTFADA
jgi:hypothetical protein